MMIQTVFPVDVYLRNVQKIRKLKIAFHKTFAYIDRRLQIDCGGRREDRQGHRVRWSANMRNIILFL